MLLALAQSTAPPDSSELVQPTPHAAELEKSSEPHALRSGRSLPSGIQEYAAGSEQESRPDLNGVNGITGTTSPHITNGSTIPQARLQVSHGLKV